MTSILNRLRRNIASIVARKVCCECSAQQTLLMQWCEPARYVCPGCAWEFGYPEYCYQSCAPSR